MKSLSRLSITLIFFLGITVLVINGCRKKDPEPQTQQPDLPELSTISVSQVNDSTAVSGGVIVSSSATDLTKTGLCWDTLPLPTSASKNALKNVSAGSFTVKITALKPGYTYYLRAFAVNEKGTAYGNQISFFTAPKWTKLDSSAIDNVLVNCLEAKNEDLYAGTNNGVFFSQDTGQTWVSVGLPGTNIVKLAIKDNILFAAEYQHLYRSFDNGGNWTEITTNIPATFFNTGDMLVHENELFFCTYENVFRSLDNGSTWVAAGSGLPISRFYSHLASNKYYVYVASADNNSYSGAIHRLAASATEWEAVTPDVLKTIKVFDLIGNESKVLFSTSNTGGVYASANDGFSWSAQSGLPANAIYFNKWDKHLICGDAAGKYYLSADDGKKWTAISNKGINGFSLRAVLLTPQFIYSVTFDQGIFKRRRWQNFSE